LVLGPVYLGEADLIVLVLIIRELAGGGGKVEGVAVGLIRVNLVPLDL